MVRESGSCAVVTRKGATSSAENGWTICRTDYQGLGPDAGYLPLVAGQRGKVSHIGGEGEDEGWLYGECDTGAKGWFPDEVLYRK